MPTKNKRSNLSVSEPLYEKIAAFRDENGIASDAGACLQLISAQLRGLENGKAMLEAMSKFSIEELNQLSAIGLDTLRKEGLLSPKE